MNVFWEGRGGGVSRLIGARRAGDEGGQAATQPEPLIFGRLARSMAGTQISS